MKLGILGGTFDPIHFGHLLTAEIVCDTLQLDKILFTPAGDPPHKQGRRKTAPEHRSAMVQLAIADNPRFEHCAVDLDRPGPHYSVDTVRFIQTTYHPTPDECFFIIGSDSLIDLPSWYNPHQFIQHCRLAVVHRPHAQPDMTDLAQRLPDLTSRLAWVDVPQFDMAASYIRAKAAQGQSIRYHLPDAVRQYIIHNQLYQSSATL